MDEKIVVTVLGFVLTGLIGNWLVQKWQARNWLSQQRFLGREKEYVALRELSEELATLLGARIFHMQRLSKTLTPEKIEPRLREYEEVTKKWNERLTSFYVRLSQFAGYGFALQLERSVQARLVHASGEIEDLAKRTAKNETASVGTKTKIAAELDSLQSQAISFNESLLSFVEKRRVEIYIGKTVRFSSSNLHHFSTWQLIKALFVRDIDSYSIVRTSMDI